MCLSNLNEILGLQFNGIITWAVKDPLNIASMLAQNLKGKRAVLKIIEDASLAAEYILVFGKGGEI